MEIGEDLTKQKYIHTLGIQSRNSKIEHCGPTEATLTTITINFICIDWFNEINAKLWFRLLLIPEQYLDS